MSKEVVVLAEVFRNDHYGLRHPDNRYLYQEGHVFSSHRKAVEELENLYGRPTGRSRRKVGGHMATILEFPEFVRVNITNRSVK